MPHTHLTLTPCSPATDSLQPREPDMARLFEANFGDEADMAHHSDDLAEQRSPPPTDHDSARDR